MARELGSCLTCEANCPFFLRDTCGFGAIQPIFFFVFDLGVVLETQSEVTTRSKKLLPSRNVQYVLGVGSR